VQVVAAPLAGIGPLGLDPEPLGSALTLGALEAFAEANVKQVLEAGFVVRKHAEECGGGEGLRHTPLYATFGYVWQGDTPPNISPGQYKRTYGQFINIEDGHFDSIASGDIFVKIAIWGRYNDVFGRRHLYQQKYCLITDDYNEGVPIRPDAFDRSWARTHIEPRFG
jgi:hypothetical protein